MPGKSATKKASSRRVPAQARSRERVARILDAAAEVFAAEGHDLATMEAIAEKAETSIGSIYQFYPNKTAVYDALVLRYHAMIRQFFDVLLVASTVDQPLSAIVDSTLSALSELHKNDVGFRAVWVGMAVTPTFVKEGEALNREIAKRIAEVFAHKLKLSPSRRLFVATMVVEIVSMMLIASARRPADAKAFLAETKTLLRLYLAQYEVA